jgi:hypothetical protein
MPGRDDGGGGKRRAAAARLLLELPERYAAPPDHSAVTMLHEARALEAVLRKHGKALLSGTKLDRDAPVELERRRWALEDAEEAWHEAREARASRAATRLRKECEGLVRDVVAAARYFLAHDEGVQRVVDAIRENESDTELVADLVRCADLLDAHAEALKKADLPKKAAKHCRELSAEFAEASAERPSEPGDGEVEVEALRNRAYWHLNELIDEIRAAGRYVFRHEPKRLVLFRPPGDEGRRPPRA